MGSITHLKPPGPIKWVNPGSIRTILQRLWKHSWRHSSDLLRTR
ncbi:MAG TPA: hypothetical protein VJN71_10130 [Nitrososphaerales archaeon]|nr:hypothetical protein [Nitrososphaerales archaeon]